MDYPLDVAFIWHMHQPYYKDLETQEYLLPWVRLHATKDYYDMAAMLDKFPGIRQTFNVVPSLLAQIEDYANGCAIDVFLTLSEKPAASLTDKEKTFILSNFFFANWDTMVKPYPRYWEILEKRGFHCSSEDIRRKAPSFDEDEMRDLQLYFNLCWFDPMFLENDPLLIDILKKGRGYTEEEKLALLEKQREITAMVIPNYKRLMEEGRIELTTTPYYHPILPLLCDTDIALRSMPDAPMPEKRFKHPEDARRQLKRGVAFHEEKFGVKPAGMWPSEGSVSEEALALIAEHGIKWIATDEEILAASTERQITRGSDGIPHEPEFLYRPYVYNAGGKDVSMIFRDHQLSDLIGFVYSSWDAKAAASDFMAKLHGIRKALGNKNKDGEHLVPVILDGENCWEHYSRDGWDFLTALYSMVEEDPLINMVTVSEHLSKNSPTSRLKKVFPGSWINHNFRIWIGHSEDNLAWDCLSEARDALVEAEKKGGIGEKERDMAWEHIMIAQGSDWCWWYGDEHSTDNDPDFDRLFRKNLINVYRLIGSNPPERLLQPIIDTEKHIMPSIDAASYIKPTIDGEVTNYFEWLGAGEIELEKLGGTMHKAEFILSRLYYGFNEKDDLYFRLDLNCCVSEEEAGGLSVSFIAARGEMKSVAVRSLHGAKEAEITFNEKKDKVFSKAAFRDILELELPSDIHGLQKGEEFEFYISVGREGGEIERWPSIGYLTIKLSGDDFESRTWNAYA